MLHHDVGGYDDRLGWTGDSSHILSLVPPAGPGRVLADEKRTETGYWATVESHLLDARTEAELICERLLPLSESIRMAIVETAGLHDIGKLHPKWQDALPAGAMIRGGPWAKCPRLLGVDVPFAKPAISAAVSQLRPGALALPEIANRRGGVRLRWAVDQKLTRTELKELSALPEVSWAGHVRFRPNMRHEAASALAMWSLYREGRASYPALAVYLAAAHHGKVRSVLRAISPKGEDVFGVPAQSAALDVSGVLWPMDFIVAGDGAAGQWRDRQFVLTDYGWTGLVADLLGPWRDHQEDQSDVGAVPENEPRRLGRLRLRGSKHWCAWPIGAQAINHLRVSGRVRCRVVTERRVFAAVPVPGLRPDSLGFYLASLGLFRSIARQWPNVRACWKDGDLQLVGGPEDLDEALDVLCDVASRRLWIHYERRWADAQRERSKLTKKSGMPFALWQASAEERHLELFAAHVAPSGSGSFNPLLGNGGKKGQRDFSEGWKVAVDALSAQSKKNSGAVEKRAQLEALLLGQPTQWMVKDLNAASWFSEANKLYNSGQSPFREGTISPWAMVLACEGLPFFSGGVSRRLGATARRLGAFPFVTSASAPRSAGEAGHDEAEVWTPLWMRPMTLPEV